MKRLDPAELAAAADAHKEWMDSPDWQRADGHPDDEMAAALAGLAETTDEALSPASGFEGPGGLVIPPPVATPDLLPRLDALDLRLAELTEAVPRMQFDRPSPAVEVPRWLLAAAGDPQSYDAPDPARIGVGWRVHPATYARIKQVQAGLGLRTLAGTLECVLQRGLAAAGRLPIR
jgi:hypothetical protein